MPARQHDLDPARNTDRTRWVWQVLRTFNAFGERWRTGRRSLPADNRRRECGSLFDLNKPPCSDQPAPGEQLARRQPIPPRRRRHNPRRAVALRHDPLLLRQRPAPPGTCRNNLEPRDLRNRRMVSHTPMSSPSARITQGGARRSHTYRSTRSRINSIRTFQSYASLTLPLLMASSTTQGRSAATQEEAKRLLAKFE